MAGWGARRRRWRMTDEVRRWMCHCATNRDRTRASKFVPNRMRSTTSSALTSTVTPRAALTARKTGRTGKAPSRRPLRVAASGESEVFRAWDQATKSQKRTDIKKIMILGAGPIVIGQVRARDLARWGRRRGGDGGRVGPEALDRGVVFFFETRRLVFLKIFQTRRRVWRASRGVRTAKRHEREAER